jgi:hypothetical protein
MIWVRTSNFINCWYLCDYESAAMWSLYSQIGSGIAVQSTVRRLRDAMPVEAYVGKVMYVDYGVADFDVKHDPRSVLFHKRNHFEHEKEVRVVYSISPGKFDLGQTGHYVNDVDLSKLAESVILAPTTPAWLQECIIAFMRTIGFGNAIRRSDLDITYAQAAEMAMNKSSRRSTAASEI